MTKKPISTKAGPPEKPYEPTQAEAVCVKTVEAKMTRRARAPKLKLRRETGSSNVDASFDHEDDYTAQMLHMFEMGTGDPRFFHGLICQIAALGDDGKNMSEDATNFALSVIRAVEPKDELEAMLAAQMAATHLATMAMGRRMNVAPSTQLREPAERGFNRLARTYATQMETLKRHRAKAQQVVRVERVTVNEGGQAIVGPVQHGGGDDGKD